MIALDCIASSFQPATCLALRKELATSALSCASKNSSIRCLWWMEHMRASISWWRVAFTHQLAVHAHSRLQFAWCRSHHERQLDWSRLASIHKHLMQLPCAFVIAKFSSTIPAWKRQQLKWCTCFPLHPKQTTLVHLVAATCAAAVFSSVLPLGWWKGTPPALSPLCTSFSGPLNVHYWASLTQCSAWI